MASSTLPATGFAERSIIKRGDESRCTTSFAWIYLCSKKVKQITTVCY